jgi:acyl-CoA dehydrogenase
VKIEEYMWTFNMPTDHPRLSIKDVWVPEDGVFGKPGGGLALAQHFVHENRIRQAASSCGAAIYCIEESVKYARSASPSAKRWRPTRRSSSRSSSSRRRPRCSAC